MATATARYPGAARACRHTAPHPASIAPCARRIAGRPANAPPNAHTHRKSDPPGTRPVRLASAAGRSSQTSLAESAPSASLPARARDGPVRVARGENDQSDFAASVDLLLKATQDAAA